MTESRAPSFRELLLARRGLASILPGTGLADLDCLRAVELECANIGYVLSTPLQAHLQACSNTELAAFLKFATTALDSFMGGGRLHEPLFRRFPEGIPSDTEALWWKKVLVHYLQANDQPCLFCGGDGTTHVLRPCKHVICDNCFDGKNYSACPVCEHQVDRNSPFFSASVERHLPKERVTFKRLDLCLDLDHEASKMFVALCERRQALSPDDREALSTIVLEYSTKVLEWLPEVIPLRENIALIFGTLFRAQSGIEIFQAACQRMTTATDMLRFISVVSGTDGSLQRETHLLQVDRSRAPKRFWESLEDAKKAKWREAASDTLSLPLKIYRFKVAKFARAIRRAIFAFLEAIPRDRLIEDMLRHQEYWTWVGEFLHPGEYESRFPAVALAFRTVRKKSEDGVAAPRFVSWNRRLEEFLNRRQIERALTLLHERPGEFARKLDWLLRMALRDDAAIDQVKGAFEVLLPSIATPVLLTLRSHLPARDKKSPIRVYWPKARAAMGVSALDHRALLPKATTESLVQLIEEELLKRFSEKERYGLGIIDQALQEIPVPFNERTASPSAVTLPRGSRIPAPLKQTLRLFLHWRQPQSGGRTTDLDLSIAFYNDEWSHIGVCSYYQLRLNSDRGAEIAKCAGDMRNGPWPNGATEFVDIKTAAARQGGARFAVMVVNNYAGMPFSQLESAFAGYMARDDVFGHYFDPRTVEMKFNVTGENGVFIPFVLDLQDQTLHWLDVQSKGQLEFNNVATSNAAITKICPELIAYFQSGVRPNIYSLALLHAAARCNCVLIRGETDSIFERAEGESPKHFLNRLVNDRQTKLPKNFSLGSDPVLALLFRGDLNLPPESAAYAIFREQVSPTLSASDLLS